MTDPKSMQPIDYRNTIPSMVPPPFNLPKTVPDFSIKKIKKMVWGSATKYSGKNISEEIIIVK